LGKNNTKKEANEKRNIELRERSKKGMRYGKK
jgi:hypothetical protein